MNPAIGTTPAPDKNPIKIPELEKFFLESNPFDPLNFVDTLLHTAVSSLASDVLLEPESGFINVRIRIDGVLYHLGKINSVRYERVVARLKVMGNLDVSEKRKVQEGQFTFDSDGKIINFRLEIVTTVYGELAVIRIHEKETIVMELGNLGMSEIAYQNFQRILNQRSGLVLSCGPTGCGKTTTLYSTIVNINQGGKYNVMTIEDPVEFNLENTNQMQTQNEIGFTFATGLKTILRLSPDIVLVGEIRDQETAEIAVQTGLSGIMVLSTIHAEDSVGALFRLLDLGIESYLLNSSLVGIVAQRLVRRICTKCIEQIAPTPSELQMFKSVIGREPKALYQGKGCSECKNSGYKKRIGIYEVLPMTAVVRDLLRSKTGEHEIRNKIFENKFQTLIGDGMEKAERGLTTVSEVLRSGLRMA